MLRSGRWLISHHCDRGPDRNRGCGLLSSCPHWNRVGKSGRIILGSREKRRHPIGRGAQRRVSCCGAPRRRLCFCSDGARGSEDQAANLGFEIFESVVSVHYQMGSAWGQQQVYGFFLWLRDVVSSTERGRVDLRTEG